jgi:hypothetical protein
MPLPSERLARIVFVTRRFGDLRGLMSVTLGAGLILGVLSWSLLPEEFRSPFQNIAFPAAVGMMVMMWGIEGYYARWFGRVPLMSSRSAPADSKPMKPDTIGALLVQMALMLDALKGIAYPGGVSLAAAMVAGYSLWVLVRDWRYRPYYVIGVAAGVAGIIITWAVPFGLRIGGRLEPAAAGPYVLTYALTGIALVAVGLLDHRLLAAAMCAGRVKTTSVTTPDATTSQLRAVLAGTCLIVVLAYIAILGWPGEALFVHTAIYLTLLGVMMLAQQRAMKRLRAEQRRAQVEQMPACEEPMAGKVAAMRGDVRVTEIEPTPGMGPVAPFDLAGHLLLPIAMAGGALLDITLRGSGVPSLLATALAASHLRIALRDWPSRRHYLLGTLAASISAAHFMFVPQDQALDWTLWFVILVCAAMLVEGLLDYRLSRTNGPDFSKERHADAI